jgi:hypothetical protein
MPAPHPWKLTGKRRPVTCARKLMTAAEIFHSLTNGGGSDFSADLFRIAGTYLKLREKIPLEIVEQLR